VTYSVPLGQQAEETSGEVARPPGPPPPPPLGRNPSTRWASTTLPGEQLLIGAYRWADIAVALLVLLTAFLVTNASRMPVGLTDFLAVRFTVKNLILLVGFLAAWRVVFTMCGLYSLERVRGRKEEAHRIIIACGLGSVVALLFPLLSESQAFRFATIPWYFVGTTTAILLLRSGVRVLIGQARPGGLDVIIVGTGPRGRALAGALGRDRWRAYNILGFVDSDQSNAEAPPQKVLGALDDLEHLLMHQVVDEVLIALPLRSRYEEIQRAISVCERAGVRVEYLADAFQVSVARPSYEEWRRIPVVTMRMVTEDYRLAVKRCLDIVGSLAAIVLLSPIMVAAAMAIKLTSTGPVLFIQERYGRHKRRMMMYKFRTMVTDAEALQSGLEARNEAGGPVFKMWNDPRVTPVGRFLRRWSIDELPQLWNVLRGEMSLVGPRPLPMRDVAKFTDLGLMRRFSVAPGLTGLWQVSGRCNLAFEDWIRLDLAYIDGWSLWLDLKILAQTPMATLTGDGAV
jgi:exopolysaccharide biosynthesis polyprenyl glycosylphosphotransferase